MNHNVNFQADNATAAELKEELFDTPMINRSVYEDLPLILKTGCDLFPASSRERDIFLTAGLVLMSGCFPHSYFYYDNSKLHFNLFAMIVAGPASGKGTVNHATA